MVAQTASRDPLDRIPTASQQRASPQKLLVVALMASQGASLKTVDTTRAA
jgi:hypothetical protein